MINLKAIEERVQNTSEGPWAIESGVGDYYILHDEKMGRTIGLIGLIEHSNADEIPKEERDANATLLYMARTDIPALLEVVEKQRIGLKRILKSTSDSTTWKIAKEVLIDCHE